jgi:CDP-diacylglycerol--serine O-phosphatidyltransferase
MQAAGYLFQIQDWSEVSAIALGLILGLAYILFELPNSFVKRRLGIKPGEIPERNKYIFIIMDQLDSGIGFALAYYLFYDISLSLALLIILTFPVVALVVKRMLFILKLKQHYT